MIDSITEIMEREVNERSSLTNKEKEIGVLASLVANGSLSLFKNKIGAFALNPQEIYEIVLQGVPYLGLAKVNDFLSYLEEKFSLNNKEAVNPNRLAEGIQKQVELFGEGMKGFYRSGDEYDKNIHYFLAANCFGDYYTRPYLNNQERELVTFVYLVSLGTLPQLKAHIGANLKNGNSKETLIQMVENDVLYVGYPRSLNALAAIKEVVNQK